MVFENVTLFEVHLDDAQFTADAGGSEGSEGYDVADRRAAERAADATAVEDSTAEGSGGRSRFFKLAAASVVVSVLATVAARRVAGRDDDAVAVDLGSAAESNDDGPAGADPSAESMSPGPAERAE